MTPKEKAEELIGKFNNDYLVNQYIIYQTPEESKRCALIAVSEIEEAVRYLDDDSEDFWFEVKQEIEKL